MATNDSHAIACEQYRLDHAKQMRMLWFLGCSILVAVVGLVLTMLGLTGWMISSGAKDVGAILGIYATVGGIVTTGIAYLAPSPLQQTARRSSDAGTPTGTPSDPVNTQEVAASPLVKEETPSAPDSPAAPASDSKPDITPDDPDLVADASGEFTEHDFEPETPIKRGTVDSLDDDYTKEGEDCATCN